MRIAIVIDANNERQIVSALWGLLVVNLTQMDASYPSVYAFARYERERPGRPEIWQSADQLRRSRIGDCEDLAAYHAAWLRVTGRDANAKIGLARSSVGFHVIVVRGDGSIEDPSAALGMHGDG
jgi:hypothetical protein